MPDIQKVSLDILIVFSQFSVLKTKNPINSNIKKYFLISASTSIRMHIIEKLILDFLNYLYKLINSSEKRLS